MHLMRNFWVMLITAMTTATINKDHYKINYIWQLLKLMLAKHFRNIIYCNVIQYNVFCIMLCKERLYC